MLRRTLSRSNQAPDQRRRVRKKNVLARFEWLFAEQRREGKASPKRKDVADDYVHKPFLNAVMFK